jgi:hypothetical protein
MPIIYVQMDTSDIPETSTAIEGIPRVFPFVPLTLELGKSGYSRSQVPLVACHASTVHACQGMTARSPGGVVYEPPDKLPFAMGLDYVAISRCQNMSDLMLTRQLRPEGFTSHLKIRRVIKEEYERLSQFARQPPLR